MNNRLAKIISINNILKGYNFAGLPGKSIIDPIKIINNIMEKAKEQKKEL